jgi:hypothetical protein
MTSINDLFNLIKTLIEDLTNVKFRYWKLN